MTIIRDPEIQRRVRRIFELYELATQKELADLRRDFPDADEEEIRGRLAAARAGIPYVPRDDMNHTYTVKDNS